LILLLWRLIAGGIFAKIITSTRVFGWGVATDLSSGLIILGVVSFMLGLFASVVFKRQAFSERNLQYFITDSKEENKDNI